MVHLAAGVLAVAIAADLSLALIAAVTCAAGYALSRSLPNIEIPTERLATHALIALAVVGVVLVAIVAPAGRGLHFAAIVAGYCAGNRLKAAGIRSRSDSARR